MKIHWFFSCHVLVGVLFVWFSIVNAQAEETVSFQGDIIAPEIKYDRERQTTFKDDVLTIEAEVTDMSGVTEVVLFYREKGDAIYTRKEMELVGSDLYRAQLSGEEVDAAVIEYYIQATDIFGNMVLKGMEFSPLTYTLRPDKSMAERVNGSGKSGKQPVAKTKESPNWLLIGGGILAAGAVAALLIQGGDKKDSGTAVITFNGFIP